MRGIASRSIARALFATAGIAAIVVAFLRGNYLLGLGCGGLYAAIAAAIVWLFVRSRTPVGGVSVVRAGFVAAFALPVGYAMAFPASLNPDMQVFIDKQATDRRARVELAAVFASDAAFRDLSVSSVHLKVVNITVHGSLGSRTDLERLRSLIAPKCRAAGVGFLHWDVSLRDSRQHVSGLDRDLFQDAEPGAAADGGGR